jgi:DNA/RNA endonuclease G (NUC1)
MRHLLPSSVAAGLLLLLSSCAHDGTLGPGARAELLQRAPGRFAAMPDVRISEIHYDNTGTDEGEAIEISGPAGADLTGWSIVLYNGSNGLVYDTDALSGTLPATCGPRGVAVVTYPSNGIQNGAPDGIALVDNTGVVIEFLSYEGTMTAADGPAADQTSSDIVASQGGSDPVGSSLQRDGADAWTLKSAHTFGACNDDVVPEPPPPPPALPSVRVVEVHYDNAGTDAGEFVEIEGPDGTDLTGWSIVLYNGNTPSAAVPYDTDPLPAVIPDNCEGPRGVVVVTYPSNGIQNGPNDGLALVNAAGEVVELWSYEGTFTAAAAPAGGIAAGRTSVSMGAIEAGTEPVGQSLWRDASGVWAGPSAATPNACNEGPLPPPPPSPPTIVITELHANPHQALGGASWGEWFEVHNSGAEPVNMQGWQITSTGQPAHTISSSLVVPAGGYAVLGRGADLTLNGGVTLDYNYFTGSSSTIFLDNTDVLELRVGTTLVDRVQWTVAGVMVRGVSRALRDPSLDNTNPAGGSWGYSTTPFGDGDFGTPGAPNGVLGDTPPVVPNAIFFSGRTASDVPLPVGFQDQVFASLVDAAGQTIPDQGFSWSAENANASVDADGVITALAAGTMIVRATAPDGTTRTYSLPSTVATASTTALYAGNAEFGEPADGDASDDFVVRRDQYTSSYNRNRGTPNWVSYNIDPTHFGAQDRCDCFTFDPMLPADFPRYTTADYTGAGAVAGFGIDRGHLARSFDRTSGSLDNATTFYFSNIIPQAADNNQGPWASFENFLGTLARTQGKEVYVIAGVAGNAGTVKNEGTIVIPASTWKVAVIMDRDEGLAQARTHEDVEVIAVLMPNVAGIRDVDWNTYRTTVNAVESASGYDVLALLDDRLELMVEAGMEEEFALVEQLIASGALDGGNGNALLSKLEAASASLDRGNRTAAVNQLEAFINHVSALARSRRLGAADVNALRAAIEALIASLAS